MKIRLGDILNAVEDLNDVMDDLKDGKLDKPPKATIKLGKAGGKKWRAVIIVEEYK